MSSAIAPFNHSLEHKPWRAVDKLRKNIDAADVISTVEAVEWRRSPVSDRSESRLK